MRLPQDIANLLAVAVRDVIWFKRNVIRYFESCDIPRSIMLEINAMRDSPTIKLVQHVLDRLSDKGDEGAAIAKAMLTKMYYWNDLHSVPPDRKNQAVTSLKALREGYERYKAQSEYQKGRERDMQSERVERVRMTELDHATLQGFRERFDLIHQRSNRQERGNGFQNLMNEVFAYYCQESKGAFNRTGEQIDGLFLFDNHWYYVEVRWKEEKASAADVSILRDRAKNAFGGDTKALFISFNGFSKDCLESLTNQADERVILMDGLDLRCVLDCRIAFDILLAEKQADLVMNKRPFVGVTVIIERRGKGR